MLPAGSQSSERDRVLEAVERLVNSHALRASETLCRLLKFLVVQSLEHTDRPLKEHEIATRLLGRGEDFDPRIDPVVRVQVGRLRSKLVEYYAREGAADDFVLEIPKGSYAPVCTQRRQLGPSSPLILETAPEDQPVAAPIVAPERTPPARRNRAAWVIPIACLAGGVLIGILLSATNSVQVLMDRRDAPLRSFWRPFLSAPEPPVVIFSNAVFVGWPETGLRYFDALRDERKDAIDHYTGIGEVFAINRLDHMFARLRGQFILKRAQLLTWDEAKTRSLVFVGSPSENLRLREIPWEQKYGFQIRENGQGQESRVVNLKPAPGEPAAYFGDSKRPLRSDYAIISRMPGAQDREAILVLAGLTTLGTQAAVEFVCDPLRIRELQNRLTAPEAVAFSAVLETEVKGGVPFSSKLVAVSPLHRGEPQHR